MSQRIDGLRARFRHQRDAVVWIGIPCMLAVLAIITPFVTSLRLGDELEEVLWYAWNADATAYVSGMLYVSLLTSLGVYAWSRHKRIEPRWCNLTNIGLATAVYLFGAWVAAYAGNDVMMHAVFLAPDVVAHSAWLRPAVLGTAALVGVCFWLWLPYKLYGKLPFVQKRRETRQLLQQLDAFRSISDHPRLLEAYAKELRRYN